MTFDVQWYERVPDWVWVLGGIVGGVVVVVVIVVVLSLLLDYWE